MPRLNVKTAVSTAKGWLADVLVDERPMDIGLEEVEFTENDRWRITLGFSRPWNSVRNSLTAITGEPAPRRACRVIVVDDASGQVLSMKREEKQEG